MNFLSMEYFIAIAEEGSFTRASERLFISQQSLSEHVKKIETELGISLFKRGRTLSLTDAGKCFLRGSKNILSARDQMLSEISFLTQQRQNQLTIAVATYDTPPFLSNLLLEFSKSYPQYKTAIVKRLVRDVASNMKGINLYFSFMPLDDNLEHYYLFEDQLCLAVSKDLTSMIYADRWNRIEDDLLKSRSLSLLKELPFILLYDKNGDLSQDLEYIFRQYHFSPDIGFSSENGDLNFSMCLKGAGALIGPQDFLRRKLCQYAKDISDSIALYPIDPCGLKVALALSYEKGRDLTLAEKRFIEVTHHYLSETSEHP